MKQKQELLDFMDKNIRGKIKQFWRDFFLKEEINRKFTMFLRI